MRFLPSRIYSWIYGNQVKMLMRCLICYVTGPLCLGFPHLSTPPSFSGGTISCWPLVSSPSSFKESKPGLSEVLNIFIKLPLWRLPLPQPPCFLLFSSVHPNYPHKLGPAGSSSKALAMRLLPATCCAARSHTIGCPGPRCVKPGKLHYTRLGHI